MYNVLPYAAECLESLHLMTPIAGETAEIIIVDDGSTDGTGDAIDSFLRTTESTGPKSIEFIVLRTPNHGLSAARNLGVSHARGLYVSFVDGDDAVTPDYLESLYLGLRSLAGTGKPLVIGRLCGTRGSHSTHTDATAPNGLRAITTTQSLNEALTGEVPINAWAKLAPRKHYLAHPYPAQQTYEDLATLMVLLEDSDRVAVLDRPIYRYRRRSDSLSHPQHPTIRQVHDFLHALRTFSLSCERAFDSGVDPRKLRYQLSLQYMRLHRLIRFALRTASSDSERNELRATDAHVVRQVRLIVNDAIAADGIGRIAALRIRLFCLSRPLYDCIFDGYEHIRRHD